MTNYKQELGYKLIEDIDNNYYDALEEFIVEYDLVALISNLTGYEVDLSNVILDDIKKWLYIMNDGELMVSTARALTRGSEVDIKRMGQLMYELDNAKNDREYLAIVSLMGISLNALMDISETNR